MGRVLNGEGSFQRMKLFKGKYFAYGIARIPIQNSLHFVFLNFSLPTQFYMWECFREMFIGVKIAQRIFTLRKGIFCRRNSPWGNSTVEILHKGISRGNKFPQG